MSKKPRSRYKIIIEDESHLTDVVSGRFSRLGLVLFGAGLLIVMLFLAGLLITVTPLRTLLPGYLKESQRSATEEGLMRLDSLMTAYEVTQAYIDNYIRVTNTDREHGDSALLSPVSRELTSDSLSTATALEQRFVSQMEERERFNISVLAPLAADGVMFSPVTSDGIFLAATRNTEAPIVALPSDESIQCSADGAVIALFHSAADKGYVIVVQHNRGFATSYSGIGTPLVGTGDNVSSGQIIALPPSPDSKGMRKITVRMWHNGLALKPYDYLSHPEHRGETKEESFESPRGR